MPNRFLVILALSYPRPLVLSSLLFLTTSTLLSTLFSFHNKQSNKQRNAQQEQMFDISGSFNVLSSSFLPSSLSHLLYLTGTNQQSVSVFCGTIRFVLSIPLLPPHTLPSFLPSFFPFSSFEQFHYLIWYVYLSL